MLTEQRLGRSKCSKPIERKIPYSWCANRRMGGCEFWNRTDSMSISMSMSIACRSWTNCFASTCRFVNSKNDVEMDFDDGFVLASTFFEWLLSVCHRTSFYVWPIGLDWIRNFEFRGFIRFLLDWFGGYATKNRKCYEGRKIVIFRPCLFARLSFGILHQLYQLY